MNFSTQASAVSKIIGNATLNNYQYNPDFLRKTASSLKKNNPISKEQKDILLKAIELDIFRRECKNTQGYSVLNYKQIHILRECFEEGLDLNFIDCFRDTSYMMALKKRAMEINKAYPNNQFDLKYFDIYSKRKIELLLNVHIYNLQHQDNMFRIESVEKEFDIASAEIAFAKFKEGTDMVIGEPIETHILEQRPKKTGITSFLENIDKAEKNVKDENNKIVSDTIPEAIEETKDILEKNSEILDVLEDSLEIPAESSNPLVESLDISVEPLNTNENLASNFGIPDINDSLEEKIDNKELIVEKESTEENFIIETNTFDIPELEVSKHQNDDFIERLDAPERIMLSAEKENLFKREIEDTSIVLNKNEQKNNTSLVKPTLEELEEFDNKPITEEKISISDDSLQLVKNLSLSDIPNETLEINQAIQEEIIETVQDDVETVSEVTDDIGEAIKEDTENQVTVKHVQDMSYTEMAAYWNQKHPNTPINLELIQMQKNKKNAKMLYTISLHNIIFSSQALPISIFLTQEFDARQKNEIFKGMDYNLSNRGTRVVNVDKYAKKEFSAQMMALYFKVMRLVAEGICDVDIDYIISAYHDERSLEMLITQLTKQIQANN